MDPLTMIVSALAAGAAAGLKPTAERAIRDAYAGIKALIQRKYNEVDLGPMERKPESEAKRVSLREDLADAGANQDDELLEQVRTLVVALEDSATEQAAAIGVDLKEVKAASLRVQKVTSEGTGIKVEKGDFSGDIDIGEVRAGKGTNSNDP